MRESNKYRDYGSDISTGGRADRYHFKYQMPPKHVRSPRFDFERKRLQKYPDIKTYLLKEFQLSGIEFGNWLTNEHRLNFVYSSIIAMHDMANVIGMGNGIGFNKLGLSFGARGMGGRANAHFEPVYWVINLTRHERGGQLLHDGGVGALAHEFGHFLDYYFGTYYNRENNQRSLTGGAIKKPEESMHAKGPKTMVGLTNKLIETITWWDKGKNVHTDYYGKLLKKFDYDTQGYWFRRNELFARAFEQYISYKLQKKKITNAFLSKQKYISVAYLDEPLLKKVVPIFDALMKAMKASLKTKAVQ